MHLVNTQLFPVKRLPRNLANASTGSDLAETCHKMILQEKLESQEVH